jgi:hypothetical protein
VYADAPQEAQEQHQSKTAQQILRRNSRLKNLPQKSWQAPHTILSSMLWLQEKKTRAQKILEKPVAWPTGAGRQQTLDHALRQGQQGHALRQGLQGHTLRQCQQYHAHVQRAPRESTVLAG